MNVLRASMLYFAVVFAVAFGMGVMRVLVVVPHIGALAAVALEVPVLLVLSWVVAGWILRHWPMALVQTIAMGALAFATLMLAELSLSTLLFGQTAEVFLMAMTTLPGALGLAGQISFAVIPALRR